MSPIARSRLWNPLVWFGLSVIVACKNERSFSRVEYTDVYYPEGTDSADILFIVDNSVSMASEQQLVAEGFGRFIAAVGETEVDFHIAIVTTDMDIGNWDRGIFIGDPPYLTPDDPYEAEFMERVKVGTNGSDKERGLQAAYYSLTSEEVAETNAGFLRGEESVLALVFVSDENDCSDENALSDATDGSICYTTDKLVPVNQYIQKLKGIKGPKGRVVASAIVGQKASEATCETSWPGTRYMTAVEQLDGKVGDICDTDYGDIMDDIGSRISGPMRIYTLTYPAIPESIEVLVDEELIESDPEHGWTYDSEYHTVRFDGDYYPPFGTTVNISYQIAD